MRWSHYDASWKGKLRKPNHSLQKKNKKTTHIHWRQNLVRFLWYDCNLIYCSPLAFASPIVHKDFARLHRRHHLHSHLQNAQDEPHWYQVWDCWPFMYFTWDNNWRMPQHLHSNMADWHTCVTITLRTTCWGLSRLTIKVIVPQAPQDQDMWCMRSCMRVLVHIQCMENHRSQKKLCKQLSHLKLKFPTSKVSQNCLLCRFLGYWEAVLVSFFPGGYSKPFLFLLLKEWKETASEWLKNRHKIQVATNLR